MTGGLFKEKELFIFCKTCCNVVPGRPLLCCSSCKEVRRWSHDCHMSSNAELCRNKPKFNVLAFSCSHLHLSATAFVHLEWRNLQAVMTI